jgi:norsolorinic acid ketoreductase
LTDHHDPGLGRALVAAFLAKSGNTVVAGVRNPDKDSSLSLSDLERGTDSKLITVKIESRSESDAPNAVKLVQSEHGIDALDVVVANAGYGSIYGDLSAVQTQEVQDMVDINALGKYCFV